MSTINLKERFSESLKQYYNYLQTGDLRALSLLMTEESYLMKVESLGFKHAFNDAGFKLLLKNMHNNKLDLEKVESVISKDLKHELKNYQVKVVDVQETGSDRITLHYLENKLPKKMYFSSSMGEWKINYKAGRKTFS